MLVIRMQRVGRKGHAQFRVVVQDSRRTPSSGKVVASLGYYNPHTKDVSINIEKAQYYLTNGAQPSDRVTSLLEKQGVKLPTWVKLASPKKRLIRNPEKLRRNQPKEVSEPSEQAPTETTTPNKEEAVEDNQQVTESVKETNSDSQE